MNARIDVIIEELKTINDALSNLKKEKAYLEAEIFSLYGAPDGQKTMTLLNGSKFVLKGGSKLEVDQEKAAQLFETLPEQMNPLKQVTVYKLDAKKYKVLESYPDVRNLIDEAVTRVPATSSVVIL